MINDQYDTGDQCQWVYQHVLSAHVFNLGDWGGVEEGRWRGVGEGVGLPGWVLGGVSVRVLGSVWCVVVGRGLWVQGTLARQVLSARVGGWRISINSRNLS